MERGNREVPVFVFRSWEVREGGMGGRLHQGSIRSGAFLEKGVDRGTFFVVDGMACQPALTGPAPPDCHWLMLAGILTFPRDFFFFFFFLLMKKQANLHAR